MIKRLRARYGALSRETLRYLVAGGLTTLVNLAVFALLRRVFVVDKRIANAASIVTAIVFAYAANKLYVFRRKTGSAAAFSAEFVAFAGSRIVTMAVEYWGYIGLTRLFNGRDMLAKVAIQVVVVAANFALSKLVVFRKTPS